MGKFGDAIRKITGSGDDDDDERDYDMDNEEDDDGDYEDSFRPRYNNSMSSSSGKALSIVATTKLKGVVAKPEKMSDAADAADHFKNKKAVVLNLDNTNKDIANRMIDFLAGVAYAADGSLKRIANTSYILVPYDVEISGDMLEELERSNSDSFVR